MEAEPYIALQEEEDEGTATCGCRLVADAGDTYSVGAAFYQCQTHAAAPAMLAALAAVHDALLLGGGIDADDRALVDDAIAEARGQ